jgi:hypothetical protein
MVLDRLPFFGEEPEEGDIVVVLFVENLQGKHLLL